MDRHRFSDEDFRRRTGMDRGQVTERPAAMKLVPLTCTTRLRLDVCGKPAKRSYLGARCADHWPAAVLA